MQGGSLLIKSLPHPAISHIELALPIALACVGLDECCECNRETQRAGATRESLHEAIAEDRRCVAAVQRR